VRGRPSLQRELTGNQWHGNDAFTKMDILPHHDSQLTDIVGLRYSGIFPKDKEPSIRTLRSWTKFRASRLTRAVHFVYYDAAELGVHIRTKLKVPARADRPLCPPTLRWSQPPARRLLFLGDATRAVSHASWPNMRHNVSRMGAPNQARFAALVKNERARFAFLQRTKV